MLDDQLDRGRPRLSGAVEAGVERTTRTRTLFGRTWVRRAQCVNLDLRDELDFEIALALVPDTTESAGLDNYGRMIWPAGDTEASAAFQRMSTGQSSVTVDRRILGSVTIQVDRPIRRPREFATDRERARAEGIAVDMALEAQNLSEEGVGKLLDGIVERRLAREAASA